jgi:hypothetical protein
VRRCWLALSALVLEVGLLALWPLSGSLSHSAPFSAAILERYAPVANVYGGLLQTARLILPGLGDAPIGEPLGASAYLAPTLALAVVFLWLGAAYVCALHLLNQGLGAARSAVWLVLAATVVFQATLAFLPGLFSQDVFSYVAYGRLAAIYDLNPYVWPPSALPKDVVLPWVASVWRTYASPYGPVWVDVQWAMARIFGELPIADQALAYRWLADTLLLANLGLLWMVLRRLTPLDRGQGTTALAAVAWNPLVLFEMGANAHNDVLMVTFSLLGLLLLSGSRLGVLATVSFSLGTLVKYLSGIGLLWVALASAARGGSFTWRATRLVALALVTTAVVLAMAWPWLELPDSLEPLIDETANVGYVNSLPDKLALVLANQATVILGVPLSNARESARTLERIVVLAAFGLYLLWEAQRVWRAADTAAVARACARSCLLYVLFVSTSVQAWYFYLPVALALTLGWRTSLARVAVGYSLLAPPALYLNYYLRDNTPLTVDLVYGLAPLWPVIVSALRTRAWAHEPAAEAVGDDHERARRHGVPRAVVEEARR